MDGSVKIGDFGLVTAIEENCCDVCYAQSPLPEDGRRHTDQVGTKLYMSPEQVRSHSLFVTCTVTSVYQGPHMGSGAVMCRDLCIDFGAI